MNEFLYGAIAMGSAVAGLLFLRFYRRTHDRFFLYFTASFWLEALGRLVVVAWPLSDESSTPIYLLRILAYGLILAAIVEKNVRRHDGP